MLQKQSSVGYLKSTKINSQAKDKSFQFKRRIRRQYNPDDINIAKLFLVIREHRTGNPQLDKTNAIKELLTQVDNINDTDYNDNGNTPLHVAVSKRHLDIVKLLLSTRDINPKAKNNRGQTPLDIINEDLNSKSKTSLDQDIIQELQGASSLKRENTGENKPEVGSPKKLRISSIKKEEPEGTKIEEGDPRTYPASGLKHTLHGNIYQLKLLMLFLKRGLDQGYSFCLATEWDDAEKFDDLVFIYGDSREKNYRFLQAKHKLDEKNNKITVGDLFTKSKDGEFNLEKYFVSYLRIKKKKEFKDSNLKDFIVCTNISFDLDNSVQDQIKKLKEVSFGKNKGKKVLVEEIGEHDSFFNTDIGTRYRIKCNDDLVLHLKQGSEVQNEMRGQSVDIIGKEIKEFLEKLVFAVDQPNEVKLSEILEDEISEDFSKRFDYIGNLSKDAYNKFEKRMLGWLKEKEGRFFDNKEAEDLFREMEQAVNSLSIIERGVRNIEQKVSEVHSYIVVEQNNKKVKEKVLFNVENPSQLFTGKKEELDKVHLLLQSTEKGVEVMSQAYSISGYLEIVKLLKGKGDGLNAVDYNKNTLLHLAVKGGFLSLVKYLIEKGADLNAENYNEDTPLHLAAKGGFLDVVKLLKGKGANLNAVNYNKNTLLHLAAKGGFLSIVEYLIENGANLNAENYNEDTPLHLAAKGGFLDVVKLLKGKGANLNAVNYNEDTPLHLAAKGGFLDVVKLLKGKGANLNAVNYNKNTLLHLAAKGGFLSIVEYLIENGANLNTVDDNQRTPLRLAAERGFLDVVKCLIKNGANYGIKFDCGWSLLHLFARKGDVDGIKFLMENKGSLTSYFIDRINARYNNQGTALQVAAGNGYLEIVKLLKENGANLNTVDDNQSTPLHLAAEGGFLSVVEYLIENGANLNTVDDNQRTPLRLAAERGFLDVVKCLIKNGANYGIKFDYGWSLLHLFARKGDVDGIKFLMENKGSLTSYFIDRINARDNNQGTALQVAAGNGYLEIVKLLKENGANLNTVDDNQSTPLHLAAEGGFLSVVEYLIENGANLNTVDDNQRTPLRLAAERGFLDVVKCLIKNGANYGIKFDYGWSLLHLFARKGDVDGIKFLMENKGSLTSYFIDRINARDNNQGTALQVAAGNGYLEIVKLLKENGANLNTVDDNQSTPLHLAAEGGFLSVVEYLIENGANLNTVDDNQRTPLRLAAERGFLDVVKCLIKNGANYGIKFDYGWSLLHLFARKGDVDGIKFLMENKGSLTSYFIDRINARDNNQGTALQVAAGNGYLEIVKLLKENGANLNTVDDNQSTPLHLAAEGGFLSVVEYLIENGANLNTVDDNQRTPLRLAAERGFLDVVKCLIKNGANYGIKFDYGWSLLHLFARKGDVDGIKFLMENKGSLTSYFIDRINARYNNQGTALQVAAGNGYLEIVKLLKENGANLNTVDDNQSTPLHLAAEGGFLSVVEYLIENGANLNTVDDNQRTPLRLAAERGFLDVVKCLIKNGANYGIKFDYGWSLLHLFAQKGDVDGIKFLMENKGSLTSYFIDRINARYNNQGTALQVAAGNGYLEIVKLLKENGANLNTVDDNQSTPLHLAAEGGFLSVVEYLIENGANLNTVDDNQRTPLNLAAERGFLSVVEYLIEKGARVGVRNYENLTPLDLAMKRFDQNSQIYQGIIDILKSKSTNRKQKNDNMYQVGEVSAEECLPSTSKYSRRKIREVGGKECLFTWEDVDEFNVEKDENRDLGKIKIDSEKFVNYIKNLSEGKRSQLIGLADQVEITGKSQGLVNRLIGNQKIIGHLNKVGKISGMIVHGMMAKNVLADFLNGNYQGVAINVGFIAGGQGFAKVAEATSLKGLKLASEGKLLLGSSLRAASPFLSRGTSAFVIYDLVNQVKAFKNGTEEALVGIVGDSIYLGVDAAEIGIEVAEAFEVLEGVSSVTGPIGAAIGAVVFVGTDIYMTVKRIDEIDQIIHLKGNEKFIEGLRAFIDMQPEQYIEELLEEKQLYNQLVNQGLEYLQQHSDIKRYVFPSGRTVEDSCLNVPYNTTKCVRTLGLDGGRCLERGIVIGYYYKCTSKFEADLDNEVLLDRENSEIKWNRARPNDPSGGRVFCLPQGDYEPAPSYGSYSCKNAIGVTDLSPNKIEGHTLINLGEGEDYAKGFLNSPNIFVVNNGSKKYYGGNKDDMFVLQADYVKGYLSGQGGINTLDTTLFAFQEEPLNIQLHIGEVADSFLDNWFKICEVNQVIGRENKADIITVSCNGCNSNVKLIDGQSGDKEINDKINIIDDSCSYQMQIIVRPNTVIYNRALEGNFDYLVPLNDGGSAKFSFIYGPERFNVNNTFWFAYEAVDIRSIDVRYVNIFNRTEHEVKFNFLKSDKEFNVTIFCPENPSYRLGNNAEMKVGNDCNLYMLENTNKSVDEIIKEYLVVANRLNKMSFFVQSLLSNETVIIGSGNHEVMHNNPLHKSHMVGNGGENVYVIDSETDNVLEVIIYDVNEENSIDTIDLRNVVKKAKGNFELQVIKSENDLLLRATVEKHEYFTVRLKDGVESYNKAHVIVENVPMRISVDKDEWSLKPQPLIFEKDKEVIVIADQDVDKDTELVTPRKGGNYKFVRSNSNDLMITNAFDFSTTKSDLCSIILSRFYETPKMATLSIKFADKEVVLKDHQEEISTARDVNVVKKEHKDQVYNDVFNRGKQQNATVRHRRHKEHSNLDKEFSESSSTRPSSWINDLFSWMKSSVSGLLNSQPTLSKETSNTSSPISQVGAKMDVNGTIMLLDVLVRKVTGQKYISTVDQPISSLEAQGYALNITNRLEKVVEQAGLKSGVSMHRLNIDFVGMHKEITGKIMGGKFNEISGILKSYVEKACPGEEAGKLSPKKFEKFIAQFNKGLLNQSIEQILHNRDGTLEVDGAKKQQMSLEPQSYLSNASVHSHSKVSTCLSEIGVTKLGGNLNR